MLCSKYLLCVEMVEKYGRLTKEFTKFPVSKAEEKRSYLVFPVAVTAQSSLCQGSADILVILMNYRTQTPPHRLR